MAIYAYNSYKAFTTVSGILNFDNYSESSGSIDEQVDDNAFELGESYDDTLEIQIDVGLGDLQVVQLSDLTYSGYTTVDGVDSPIFTGTTEVAGIGLVDVNVVFSPSVGDENYPVSASALADGTESTSLDPLCFAAGTLIATPDGERAVESLAIGDHVTTTDGRTVAVKWLGRRTSKKMFSSPDRFSPVRIAAGALGDNLPHSDLTLTAEHGLWLEGYVVNAGALVNGDTVSFVPVADLPDAVTYYHVETADHDLIVANGAAAETYIDYIGRRAFDNFQQYLDLYGDETPIRELPAPRISARRLLPGVIRQRIAAAAEALRTGTSAAA
ncbi:hypothetical protein DLJ53_28665 [Acuticoccus sediminis]|uniref:Hedgehog/Intein (Hint) domain-containing protein n=1 Tax=Acuticoccus sediminis TaxID=2184697 RepID=A0A8B2NKD6_9HYPH|nr:Hint domain-containing protein [Acuticoccus sediminis]RAH97811.1 hypothetical protein DLJ53_28665 [Acuticoccus sediminis]